MSKINKNIFEEAFRKGTTYDDSTPLFLERHPMFIGGIKLNDEWRDLHDVIHNAFIDWTKDGDWVFISPEHEAKYEKIFKVFSELFIKLNKD
jgi:hypothetical protein